MPLVECTGCGGVLPLTDAQLRRRIECGRCKQVFVPCPAPPEDPPEDPIDDNAEIAHELAGRWAVSGLIVSIIGLILSLFALPICCPFVGIPFGITGIILGRAGRESPDHRNYANSAVVIGAIDIILPFIATLVFILAITIG